MKYNQFLALEQLLTCCVYFIKSIEANNSFFLMVMSLKCLRQPSALSIVFPF